MRKLTLFILFFIIIKMSWGQIDEKRIENLINNNQFFELKRELDTLSSDSTNFAFVLGKALTCSYFNQPYEAIIYLETLLSNFQDNLGIQSISMDILRAENYASLYDYNNAVVIYDNILRQITGYVDIQNIYNMEARRNYYYSLRDVPPLRLEKPAEDCELNIYLNGYGMIEIPVHINGYTENFIMDTGASECTVTKDFAEKLGIKILADSLSLNYEGMMVSVGVMDSLQIGEIQFKNVIFYILPDEKEMQAFNPSLNTNQNLLGLPIIKAMQEIHIFPQEQKILVPLTISPYESNSNLILLNNIPYVEVFTENDSLRMFFDTGNNKSTLSEEFYIKNKDELENRVIPDTVLYGTVAGIAHYQTYLISDFNLRIGEKNIHYPFIRIFPNNPQRVILQQADGTIGADIFSDIHKIIVNFSDMWIKVE